MIKCIGVKPDFFAVNYFESMRTHSEQFDLLYAKKCPIALVLKALYDHFIDTYSYRQMQRIPKIIHQIWLGGKLPQQYNLWQQTWIEMHPGWTYKLWTDKDIEKLHLVNKELYDICVSYGAKADIARYEILYQFGGLYVDCDVECLQSCDIFHHCCDIYASCDNAELNSIIRITNALIGAKPFHPIIGLCIEKIKQLPVRSLIGPDTIITATGSTVLTSAFCESVSEWDGPCVVFPSTYFVPLPYSKRFLEATSSDEKVRRWIKQESYAIHYWHGSWTDNVNKNKVQ
jgi:mannosyltransferase OCH1-like enzyme